VAVIPFCKAHDIEDVLEQSHVKGKQEFRRKGRDIRLDEVLEGGGVISTLKFLFSYCCGTHGTGK
jgi:hypothetical protein